MRPRAAGQGRLRADLRGTSVHAPHPNARLRITIGAVGRLAADYQRQVDLPLGAFLAESPDNPGVGRNLRAVHGRISDAIFKHGHSGPEIVDQVDLLADPREASVESWHVAAEAIERSAEPTSQAARLLVALGPIRRDVATAVRLSPTHAQQLLQADVTRRSGHR